MAIYTITTGADHVTRVADGATIPADPDNSDYAAYLAWVAEGNSAEVLPEPHPTAAERAETAASAAARRAMILGAKDRARQITALAQTPGARTATAWTQAQRVAILDGVGDLAKMLSWLADDILSVPEQPDG